MTDRGGIQSGLLDMLCLIKHIKICFAGLISNTFFGCHAPLFKDRVCGYPEFCQIVTEGVLTFSVQFLI